MIVVAVDALPDKLPVIVPAAKLPDASLLTIVLAVLTLVAALANTVAALILEADELPTFSTVGEVAVPPKSFVS
ncbi:hypothetical protein ADIARSV_3060 [Arcticibacter svalbardensis MN12-7]|uniref:Uncharacterized protein n=1 Tax=Arcticibacter svalbardensis MN12-7 TaxID=1150600 RepID=R9GQC5_9SPHI|nr:hypothetical protein ADIARSV_3060 [Arcticibacter svalbardensis MN12-7]